MTTDLDTLIARVRELDAAATKGPWSSHPPVSPYKDGRWSVCDDRTNTLARVNVGIRVPGVERQDAALIAYYRDAAPALADECERLRRENSELATLNSINTHGCDRALEQAELAAGVVAGLTTECERLRERERVLEGALRRVSRESQDNLIAAIAEDALSPGEWVTGAALAKGGE